MTARGTRMASRLTLRAALPVLLFSFVQPAFAGEPHWLEVRSPHFSVVTDAGEKRGRAVALHFEQMRLVFGVLLPKGTARLPVPLQIIAFRNTPEMRQVVPLWNGKPAQVSGVFQSSSDRNFIMLDMSVDDPWEVVFHEYAHQLLKGYIPGRLPPWFEEGFAEYFSTIKVRGSKAAVGLPSERFTQVFARNKLMKLADLFQVQQNSATYNERGDHRSLFYAESWLVVHYLNDKSWLPQVSAYAGLIGKRNLPVDAAIQQAFGVSAAQFDAALASYLQSPRKYYKVPTTSINGRDYSVKHWSALDAKAVLADAHLHSRDYQDQAVAEFAQLLQMQPGNVAALRGLGHASLMRKDYARAHQYLDQALANDPNDSRVLYYAALLAQHEGFSRDPGKLAVLENNLERSIALDPDFADAYHILAWVQVALQNYNRGLQTLGKAVDLSPQDDGYRFDLGEMYYLNQKYGQAIAIWRQLSGSGNAFVSEQLAEAIAAAEHAQRLSSTETEGPRSAAANEKK
jgi:tetratricopeptide (TPR) repeat protein